MSARSIEQLGVAKLEPFLKWPGGKRALAPTLVRLAPREMGHYFEPFLGSGALFFALKPERAVLGDSNAELIECYEQIRDACDEVIDELRQLRNSEAEYYRVRHASPSSPAARAARLIYLVNLAFNGIYRINKVTGQFNVPYGHRTSRKVLEEGKLRAASLMLARARTLAGDFEAGLGSAREGDFVYLDPPYTAAHSSNGFVRYNQQLFSWADQIRLARCAARLADRGVKVMVTNAPHKSILELYPGFRCTRVKRPSQIAANVTFRKTVTEVVLTANV